MSIFNFPKPKVKAKAKPKSSSHAAGNAIHQAVTPTRKNTSAGRAVKSVARAKPVARRNTSGAGKSSGGRSAGKAIAKSTRGKVGAHPFGKLTPAQYNTYLALNYQAKLRVPGVARDARARELGLHKLVLDGKWDGMSYFKHVKRSAAGQDWLYPDVRKPWDPATNKPYNLPVAKAAKWSGQQGGADSGARAGVKILEQTTRPLHAIAGAADAAVTGKGDVGKEAMKGLKNETKTSFSDVLKHVGAPAAVASAGGLALDIGADPTTYLTFGTGTLLELGAKGAYKAAEKRALKAGLSEEQAAKFGERASVQAQRAAKAAKHTKGVTVKVASKEVPVVRRASASVGNATKAVTRAVTPAKARAVPSKARAVATEFRPSLKPTGADEAHFQGTRQAARTSRASSRSSRVDAQTKARAVKKKVTPDEYAVVIHAVESGNIGKALRQAVRDGHVPAGRVPDLASVAHDLRSSFRGAQRQRVQAGVSAADVRKAKSAGAAREYFPHKLPPEDANKMPGGSKSRPVVQVVESAQKRSGQKPLAAENVARAAAGKPEFSTDIPSVTMRYQAETGHAVSQAQLARDIAGTATHVRVKNGHIVRKDGSLYRVAPGDAVYFLGRKDGKYGLHEIKGKVTPPKGGQLVVLNKHSVDHALQTTAATTDRSAAGSAYDKATGTWKALATGTPGFHVRNLLGEHWFAYLNVPGHLIPKYEAQAVKVLKALGRVEKHPGVRPVAKSGGTITVRGVKVPVEDVAATIRAHGGARTGYVARDIGDQLAARTPGRIKRTGNVVTSKAKRAAYNIEDIGRVMSTLHYYNKGESWQQAVQHAVDRSHIDYGDLTQTERKYAKRVMPFYTFSARTLPNTGKALVQKPGKFAAMQKTREESAKATGVDPLSMLSDQTDWQARSLGLPVKIAGVSSMVDWGTPAQLLNELPTADSFKHPLDYGRELTSFALGLLNPLIKSPLELGTNHSFFFKEPIDPGGGMKVAAPWWAQMMYSVAPGPTKSILGAGYYTDKKSGKRILGISPNADYAAKAALPGLFNQAGQLSQQGVNRAGMDDWAKWTRLATGIKASPMLKGSGKKNETYAARDRVRARLKVLRDQHGLSADHPNAEYRKLLKADRSLTAILDGKKKLKGRRKKSTVPSDPTAPSSGSTDPTASSGSSGPF